MTRTVRLLVFLVGGGCVAVLFAMAFFAIPEFGHSQHLFRDLSVRGAVAHQTANVVQSINFDQRALDTLGEETILLGSVIGVAVLLRPSSDESERRPPDTGHTLEATRLTGYLLLPVTLLLGLDVVVHGHLTPGGGFQGGLILATGYHLLYVGGSYEALARLRSSPLYEALETLGVTTYIAIGLAGTAVTGAFLSNIMPWGSLGQLLSAGTVPVISVAVGLEVAAGLVVALAKFFEQYITVEED